MTCHLARAAVALALLATLSAQDWLPITPAGLRGRAMVYDVGRARPVLLGSTDAVASRMFTWELDGTSWHLAAGPGPSFYYDYAFAYDLGGSRTVLFGGDLGDTWEYDGSGWTQITFALGATPSVRGGFAMTYDWNWGTVVLFGGAAIGGELADTWTYTGRHWSQVHPSTSPPPRSNHAMAFDVLRQRTVLFGGVAQTTERNDTWLFDGNNWTQANPAHSPTPRAGVAMAYDLRRGRTILVGGGLPDQWEFDGVDWLQVAASTAMGPCTAPTMSYDLFLDRAIVFADDAAGNDATWTYDGISWTAPAVPTGIPDPLAFDTGRGCVVSLVGYSNGNVSQTWELTRDTWRLVPTIHAPNLLIGHALAYDAGR